LLPCATGPSSIHSFPQRLLSPVAITHTGFYLAYILLFGKTGGEYMAKEKEEKEKEEKAKEKKPGSAGEQVAPKKKRSKLVFVLVVLMLLAGSAAGAYFFYGDQILDRYGINAFAGRNAAKKEAAVKQGKGGSSGPILTLEPFIFNLAGNNSKFAKVSLAVHLQDGKAFEEAKKMVPVLRDKALTVLSAKSAEMLIDVNNRDSIKKELQESLRGLFKEKDDLNSVYITDIIIP
jgi:flagellar FliL protein